MKRNLFTLALLLSVACVCKPQAKPSTQDKSAKGFTFVDTVAEADATHIYFGPANPASLITAEDMKRNYDTNPKAYARGWKDGFNWASKQSNLSLQAEDAETKRLYGDVHNEPGQTKALGFQGAVFIVQSRRNSKLATDVGPPPLKSAWNGLPGGHYTEDAIKETLDDPGSFRLVRSSEPSVTKYQGLPCWKVKVVFRAKNRLGAYAMASTMVYLTGGDRPKILGTESDVPVNR